MGFYAQAQQWEREVHEPDREVQKEEIVLANLDFWKNKINANEARFMDIEAKFIIHSVWIIQPNQVRTINLNRIKFDSSYEFGFNISLKP